MRLKKLLFLVYFCFQLIDVDARKIIKYEQQNEIFIEGWLKELSGINSIKIKIYRSYFGGKNSYEAQEYTIKVNDKHFSCKIPLFSNYSYIKISYPRISNHFNRMLDDEKSLFFVQSMYKINCILSNDDILFSGKYAEVMNCQKFILNNLYTPSPEENEFERNKNFERYYLLQSLRIDSFLNTQLKILDQFKLKLTEDEFNVIRANCIGINYGRELGNLRMSYMSGDSTEEKVILAKKIFAEKFLNISLDTNNLLAKSTFYCEFLFKKEVLELEMFKRDRPIAYQGYSFGELYANLERRYKGYLRDELVLWSFIELIRYSTFNAYMYLNDAISLVVNSNSKKILQRFKNAYHPGMAASLAWGRPGQLCCFGFCCVAVPARNSPPPTDGLILERTLSLTRTN